MLTEQTLKFSLPPQQNKMQETLAAIGVAISERGMDPVQQLIGYLLTEDPGYITSHKGARTKIVCLDRDEILCEMLKTYLGIENISDGR